MHQQQLPELQRSLSEDLDLPRRTSSLPPLPRLKGRFEVTELEMDQNATINQDQNQNQNRCNSDELLEECVALLKKRATGVLDECRVLREENSQLRKENAQLRALLAKLASL